jgi:uncharacterized protein YkwD
MDFLTQVFSPATYGLNGLDVVIFCILIFYAYEGYVLGFVASFLDLLSFVIAFLVALKSYAYLGSVLLYFFSLPPGFAKAIGFFVAALITEIVLSILLRRLYAKYLQEFFRRRPVFFQRSEKFLGILPGLLSACIILAFLFSIVLVLPTSAYLKRLVTTSKFGSPMVSYATYFEQGLQSAFGGALQESLTFLSVRPESNETVNLRFTVTDGKVDASSEEQMLVLINMEREKRGLSPFVMDEALLSVARAYSHEMFSYGYFSHIDRLGRTPFERMQQAGISFVHAGENLALAPSVELAMQGLMDSPGHRANMLSDKFGKIGIGVVDGGIYGKMFTQEFTD